MDSVNDDAKGVGHRRIEVLTSAGCRRQWSDDDKARIVAETAQPGAVVTEVARRWQVTPQQVFDWRRQARRALAAASASAPVFIPLTHIKVAHASGVQKGAPLLGCSTVIISPRLLRPMEPGRISARSAAAFRSDLLVPALVGRCLVGRTLYVG